ncbi:MAG TPA: hypothetical protein VLI39_08550 [Sedimentisphaerales bacterium]|nr:hypothetical protein [Sedimentisphaerales bacterium]
MVSNAGVFFAKDREQVILKFKELIDKMRRTLSVEDGTAGCEGSAMDG